MRKPHAIFLHSSLTSHPRLRVPNARVIGNDYVFIQIAMTHQSSFGSLHDIQFLQEKVIDRVLIALGWTTKSFEDLGTSEPWSQLIWVRFRLPQGFPGRETQFPCIGQYYWPVTGSEPEAESDHEEPGPPDSPTEDRELPQIPPEMVFIVERKYLSEPEAYPE